MKANTKQVLAIMQVVAWVVYIGLCIKTGAAIISVFVSLFVNPEGAKTVNMGLNLSKVYHFDVRHYVAVASLIIGFTALKAHIFYLLIKVSSKLNVDYPFSPSVASLIESISYVTLETGIVALVASGYCDWLGKRGVVVHENWGSTEFMLMAGVVFVIAMVFKRGTEIQAENELTI